MESGTGTQYHSHAAAGPNPYKPSTARSRRGNNNERARTHTHTHSRTHDEFVHSRFFLKILSGPTVDWLTGWLSPLHVPRPRNHGPLIDRTTARLRTRTMHRFGGPYHARKHLKFANSDIDAITPYLLLFFFFPASASQTSKEWLTQFYENGL